VSPRVARPDPAADRGSPGARPRPSFGFRLLAACVALLLLAAPSPGVVRNTAQEEPEAQTFSFQALNRDWEQLIDDLPAVTIGPAEVALRSPEHSLTILHHAATLSANGDGVFETELELEIEGSGTIAAEIVIGTLESQLTQDLIVPHQTPLLRGATTFRRSDEGYWIRTERMPETTRVRIESELGTRLFTLCRQMALVLVSLDCDAIERAVTLITVPLPEAGGEYLIPLEDTTAEERRAFERFLRDHAAPGQ